MALGKAAFGKVTKTSLKKKITKPLIEKRRRARINSCLEELKSLLGYSDQPEQSPSVISPSLHPPEKLGKNSSKTHRHKLEKADILEMTVKYVKEINSKPTVTTENTPQRNESLTRFEAGYHHCVSEVNRFVQSASHLPSEVRSRLLEHLRCGLPSTEAKPAVLADNHQKRSSPLQPISVSAACNKEDKSESLRYRLDNLPCIPFKVKFKISQKLLRERKRAPEVVEETGPIWRPW